MLSVFVIGNIISENLQLTVNVIATWKLDFLDVFVWQNVTLSASLFAADLFPGYTGSIDFWGLSSASSGWKVYCINIDRSYGAICSIFNIASDHQRQ